MARLLLRVSRGRAVTGCWWKTRAEETSSAGQYHPARAKYLEPAGARRVLVAHTGARLHHHALGLHQRGHVVLTTSDGDEALSVVSSVARQALPIPDVVVLDLHGPVRSGIHLLEAMRRDDWTVPIVVLSTRLDRQVRSIMASFDVFACLTKPVSSTLLARAVEEALLDR